MEFGGYENKCFCTMQYVCIKLRACTYESLLYSSLIILYSYHINKLQYVCSETVFKIIDANNLDIHSLFFIFQPKNVRFIHEIIARLSAFL